MCYLGFEVLAKVLSHTTVSHFILVSPQWYNSVIEVFAKIPCHTLCPFSVGFPTKILFRMWGIGQSTFSPSVPPFQLFSPRRLAEEAIGAPPSRTSLAQHCNEMTTDFQARDLWLNINHKFEIFIYNLSLLSCPILRRIFESLRRPFRCAPSVLMF